MSSIDGLTLALKTKMASASGAELAALPESLNLLTQSDVGILASFNAGVSMRLKSSVTVSFGAYVTPLMARRDRKAFVPASRLRKRDLPQPVEPRTVTVGLVGFRSSTCHITDISG